MGDLGVSRHVRVVANERDELVLLHTRTGQWFYLNRSGATLWNTLASGRPIEEAAVALARRHPTVAAGRIRADLQRLVSELTRADLITSLPASAGAKNPAAVPMALPRRSTRRLRLADRLAGVAGLLVALALIRLPFSLCLRSVRIIKRLAPRVAGHDEAVVAVLATSRIARFSPGRVACLELSLAAFVASALRGRRLDWCLGTSVDPLRFHAWVEAGGRMVIDPGDEPADRSYRVALRV